jgi:hypothetical protein
MAHLKERLFIPELLAMHTDSDELSALISTRWREHLAERFNMIHGSHAMQPKTQQQLIQIRLQRAKLEVCLYEKAISSWESGSVPTDCTLFSGC